MKALNLMVLAMLVALPFSVQAEEAPAAEAAPLSKLDQIKNALRSAAQAHTSKSHAADSDFVFSGKKVKGTYVTGGFSDFVPDDEINAAASIGQLVLKGNGTGYFTFLAISVTFVDEFTETFNFYDVPVTYAFDLGVNGVATLTLPDFFGSGSPLYLYLVFKVRDGEVVGFNQLLINDSVPPPPPVAQPEDPIFIPFWFIGDGEKNSKHHCEERIER